MSNGDETTLLTLPRGDDGQELRVSLSEFKGKTSLNIREWYDAGGTMRPGKKGINIREGEFEQFKDAVTAIQIADFA